jgi:glutamine amidotransferase
MVGRIVIVDYHMGNLHSVSKRITKLRSEPVISSVVAEIEKADKIILPGVGHFKKAMDALKHLQLIDVLNEQVLVKKKPILGICLGMQLMAMSSEEGEATGLGWLNAEVKKFKISDSLTYKIPHTGWNQAINKKKSELTKGIADQSEFYFVHGYHMLTHEVSDVLYETVFEYPFISAVERNNIFGVQFHPEKSHDVGNQLLKNFIDL